jgi:hypothetical protein
MKPNLHKLIFLPAAVVLILLYSCGSKGGDPVDPCSGVTISVSGSANNTSGQGTLDGSISVSATGGSGFTFSINGGAFQASGNFTGLAAGAFTITAKDSRGCTGSKSFTVLASDPCTSASFTVNGNATSATPCTPTPNGSITVITSGGGTGFTYNLNGGAFQATATFNNLAPNTYTVGAKESGGCIKTASITVNPTAAGTLFTTVKTIITANCALSGCHSGAIPTGGIDFTQNCQIIANSARIKVRAVDNFGSGQQMPPPPTAGLSVADRNAITNWVNAGGQYSN